MSPGITCAADTGGQIGAPNGTIDSTSNHRVHRIHVRARWILCRANFLFVAEPRDPSDCRMLMFDNGGYVAPLAPPLAYTIEVEGGWGPRVVWSDEPPAMTLEEALLGRRETPARADEPKLMGPTWRPWMPWMPCISGGRALESMGARNEELTKEGSTFHDGLGCRSEASDIVNCSYSDSFQQRTTGFSGRSTRLSSPDCTPTFAATRTWP
jgi:hypothetical protein